MRPLGVGTVLSLTFFAIIYLQVFSAHSYVFEVSSDGNGSQCRQQNPMSLNYFNGASLSDSLKVERAIQAWNGVPAMLYLSSSSESSAKIIVNSINDPDYTVTGGMPYAGITYNTSDYFLDCSNGFVNTPVHIDLNDATLLGFDFDVKVLVAAHEIGHAIGIDHSQVLCSLMWPNQQNFQQCGVYFPVIDDIRAVAALYGWAANTAFAGNEGCCGGEVGYFTANGEYMPPIDLLASPQSPPTGGARATVSTQASLPGELTPAFAMMTAYVTPQTLYRFHLSWETSSNTFAALEVDNDGVKLVEAGAGAGSQSLNTGFTPQLDTSYFLELLVERQAGEDLNAVRAHAYVYQGNLQTGNGEEQFVGHAVRTLGTLFCYFACTWLTDWGVVNSFQASAWQDENTDPASHHTLTHFWNFQGSSNKQPAPQMAASFLSLNFNSNPKVGIQTSVSYQVRTTQLVALVYMNWGDGMTDTATFPSRFENVVVTGDFQHTYSSSGVFTAKLTVVDSFNSSSSQNWTVGVGDFGLMPSSPATVTASAGATGSQMITVSSMTWFTGNVNLAVSSSTPSGLTCSLSASSVTLTSTTTSATSTLSCTATVGGDYSVTVTGTFANTEGSLSHTTAPITFHVVDFTISGSPSPLYVAEGNSAQITVTLTSLNNFAGSVSVASSISPVGPTVGPASTTIGLTAGGTNSFVLTVSAGTTSPGSYTLTVVGTATSGSPSRQLTVPMSVVTPLTASFTYSPVNPTTGPPVSYVATATGGTGYYTFTWNFGDGSTFVGNPVSHSYPVKGSYSVVLTVGDANAVSLSTTTTQTVVVTPQPLYTGFTPSSYTPGVGNTVTFTGSAAGGTPPYGFSWAFGDSTTGSGNPISHIYYSGGSYFVTLTTADANQVSSTMVISINVVDFSISIDTPSISIRAGETDPPSIYVSLQGLYDFHDYVTLSANPVYEDPTYGPIISFEPETLLVSSTGTVSSLVNVFTCERTPSQIYTITITATDAQGHISHTVTLTITVTGTRRNGTCPI